MKLETFPKVGPRAMTPLGVNVTGLAPCILLPIHVKHLAAIVRQVDRNTETIVCISASEA